MHKIILIVLGRPEAVRACLDAALYASGILGGARLIALATRLSPDSTVMPSEEVLTARRRAEIERRVEAEIAVLSALFAAWRKEHEAASVEAEWVEASGSVASEVVRRGQAVELIVVASGPAPQDRAEAALHAALVDTHRPVLVVPDRLGASIGRRIAIAWHEDEPAKKATLAAMPFLAAAEQVWVLYGARGKPGEAPPLPALLVEHDIHATALAFGAAHAAMGKALLAEAHALGADLVVLGAFHHSPVWETVLGGVTRTVLQTTDLPLLMRH